LISLYLAGHKLDAFDGTNLDYEDIQIQCEVVAEPGEATKNMKNIAEITEHKDENGNITMLQSNIITINEVTSSVAVRIQEELINSEESIIHVKLRQFFRHKNIIRYGTRYKNKIFRHRNSRN